MKLKPLFWAASLYILSLGSPLQAQNFTSSPLSMYGIGELSANDGGKYAGMGNAGMALNRRGFINTHNPASITRMDTTNFLMDVGVGANYSYYRMNTEKESTASGNLTRISFAFRFMPHWYMSLGMTPYSSTGYLITSSESIEGSPSSNIQSVFTGSGGLSKIYLTNAFSLGKRLSVGASVGIVMGTVEETETNGGGTLTQTNQKRAFYGQAGIHYQMTKHIGLAATYAMQSLVKQDTERSYTSSSTSTSISDEHYTTDAQYLPQTIGGGISYFFRRWMVTADYTWKQWSVTPSSISKVKFVDQEIVNLGAIYTPRTKIGRTPMEFMGGVGYYNSYMQYSNGKMYNMSLNVGLALPVRESTLTVGCSWLKQVNTKGNLMREDRLTLNVALTFGEFLYRGKLQ